MKFSFGRPFTRLFRPRRPIPYRREAALRCRPNLEGLESRVTPVCGGVYWPAPYNTFVGFPANVIGVCNTNDNGSGSLREAITFANSRPLGRYVIALSIPTPNPQQVHTIHLQSPLPASRNPVVFNAITYQLDWNQRPMIELDGSGAGGNANGLVLNGAQSAVDGFIINNFGGSGIILQGQGHDLVAGNYIGTDSTGTQSRRNTIGITIRGGSERDFIGPDFILNSTGLTFHHHGGARKPARMPVPGNVISGNTQEGILLTTGTANNEIFNNFIGTDYLGLNAVPNRGDGVVINQGASRNHVFNNTISGNTAAGVSVQDPTSVRNVIVGNKIGTNAAGTLPIPNATGVEVNQALDTIIGRSDLLSLAKRKKRGNLISGNTVGINILNVQADLDHGQKGTTILNNFIGTDVNGTAPMANLQGGVIIQNSIGTTIGVNVSTGKTLPNVISANGNEGILLSGGSSRSLIGGNFIGTDVTGTMALSNTIGVYVQGGINNTIGGTLPGFGNILAGNAAVGVTVVSSQSTGNIIEGNYIGTNSTGSIALPNGVGVNVAQTAANTTIGGTDPMAGNYIFYNATNGISISDSATGSLVEGNTIFANNANGVAIARSSNNTIGGLDPGAGNTITANGADGVLVDTGTGNLIQANSISGHPRLGIELLNRGNLSQAAPVINFAGTDTSQNITTVTGTLSGVPFATYTVDFYYNTALDSNGFGEGQTYIGTITVQTDASGQGIIAVDGSMVALAGAAPPGTYLSATATDPANNTSAFSIGFQVFDTTPPAGDISGGQGNTAAAGAATLAQAQATPLTHNAAAVVWQRTAIVRPEDGGPARMPDEPLALQVDHATGAAGTYHVLDAVFAASSEDPLDGSVGDGPFQLSQSLGDRG